MTNAQIILQEQVTRGIKETLHTYAKWKSLGYQVKRGEKAMICTGLWKMQNSKAFHRDEEDSEADGEVSFSKMHLCKAYLFGEHQVEKIETEEKENV